MSATNCLSDKELLALQHGTLTGTERQEAAGHLSSCRRCQAAAIQMTPSTRKDAQKPSSSILASWLEVPLDEEGRMQDSLANRRKAEPRYDFLAPPVEPGELGRLAHYRVERLLGKGGMGLVFLAEDAQLQRPVALKVIAPDQAEDLEARLRFLREARAAAAIKHPHVVTIYQVGQEGDVCYMAMEFLEGRSLEDWLLSDRRATPAQAVRIGRQIALGLAAAHSKGLIHRDLKPGNVWLEGAEEHVKLLDFGLVQGVQDNLNLTATGLIVGTPAYMSPEQARGFPLDGRCDLFSLGGVLYRMLSGARPFGGETTMALLTALAVDEPEPLRTIRPDVPPALTDLVTRLLSKAVEQRPASARDVADELADIERSMSGAQAPVAILVAEPVEETSSARTQALFALRGESRPPQAVAFKPARRRRPWKLIAGVVLVLGTLLGGVAFFSRGPKPAVSPVAVAPTVPAPTKPAGSVPKTTEAKPLTNLALSKQMEVVRSQMCEANAGFDPKAISFGVDNGAVLSVAIEKTPVRDLGPLRGLPALRSLSLQHLPNEVNLATLKNPTLQWIDLNATLVTDLAPIASLSLVSLECPAPRNGDLGPLRGMKTLKRLLVSGKTIRDLTPLSALSLEQFACENTNVSDLEPLRKMTALRQLTFHHSDVKSLAPLQDLQLSWLDCHATPVEDLTPLAKMPLNYLDCSTTLVKDLTPLAAVPLQKLLCGETLVRDLTPLAGSTLEGLACNGTKVRDLTPLRGTKLNSLNCSSTDVDSLEPLASLPLMVLICDNSKVTDLTPLKPVQSLLELTCDGPKERDIAVLRTLKKLHKINGNLAANVLKP